MIHLFSFCRLFFQVYIIKVSWSDGSTESIFRRYSKFFDLQVSNVCVCDCARKVQGVGQVLTVPPGKTGIGQEVNGSALSLYNTVPL